VKRCKHLRTEAIAGGVEWPFEHRGVGWKCSDCGEALPLGPSNDEPEAVRIEMRAAEIAATGNIIDEWLYCRVSDAERDGWEMWPDWGAGMSRMIGQPESRSEWCGWLARAIAEHAP
jgi:hypothetical protein